MWWRALLAAAVVTCTVTLAQGPQPLNQIKDVLCVMLLNSIQKEDLDAITRRLQNVNTSANNDELSSIQRIIELTANQTDTTKVIKENKDPNQPKETNKTYGKIVSSRTEKYLPDDQQIKCDSVIDYSKGQPTLFSLVHFWRNCLNISRPIENYTSFSFENTLISTQNKDNSNLMQKKFYVTTPPQEKAEEINKKYNMQTLSDEKKRYDEHSVNGPVGKEIKPEVQFLQQINDFYKNAFNSRRNSRESLKLYGDNIFNALDAKSSEDVMTNESSFTTSSSVDIDLNNLQSKLVRAVDSTEIANKTSSDNSLYYGEYEEHNYLNTKDLINIKEPAKNYKSGYGNIFYTYNESNAIKTNPGQFKDILKGLAKIPSNSFLGDKNLESKESKLDIIVKLHEVLKFLENTTVERINSHDNRPNTDAIGRRFTKKNQTPTTVLRQNFDAPEPARQGLNSISTANAEVVHVPSVHYVNYLPPKNNSNGRKFPAKRIPKLYHDIFEKNNYNYGNEENNVKIDVIKSGEIAKNYYFHPKNIALQRVMNYQENEPHIDAVRRQLTKNIPVAKQNKIDLYESMKNEILSTSAEVVSVSSIHYVNYLYPTKNINRLSGPRDSKTSNLMPQFSKKYIYSREADEHNYYQYEKVKVKVVASNRNLHQRYYFYPEISSNKLDTMMKHRLPRMYFTPNLLERVSGNLNDYAFDSKIKKQDGSIKNIPIISDAFFSSNGNMQNVNSDDSTKLVPNMPLTRQSEQNKTLDTVTCTQKYVNTTDRRMNADMNKNESVIIENNKILPKKIITDIAESVKAVILEDLRKELNISSSTKYKTTISSLPTTIYTSTSTPTIKFSDRATRNISKTHKIVTQDIVLDKIMKFLEQMNTSKNAPYIKKKDFQASSNENVKMLTKDIEILTTETYNVRKEKRQKNNYPTNRDYNFALQNHKNRVTDHKVIQRQKRYKLKDNILIEPKTFQTNELEISPLGVYVESFVSPINQNIIVSPSRKERGKDNRGNNVNYYKPQEMKAQKIQNNPFVHNYYPNKDPTLTSDTRANLRNTINIHSNDNYDFQNRDESEEHNDVKYLDDKFLNKVVKDSTALEIPSDKDCCDREYASQLMYDCCNDKVVSRRQKSLIKNEPNNDSRYRNFLQSQHKVNAMLERVLASKTKFRSVESI